MIVLDTHVVLWLAQTPSMLSEPARTSIRNAREQGSLHICDKTLWELAMLISRGVVSVKTTTRDFLLAVEKHFTVLPVTATIAERSVLLTSKFPKDPTDRLIAATALDHGFKLVTKDKLIRASGEVPCIW